MKNLLDNQRIQQSLISFRGWGLQKVSQLPDYKDKFEKILFPNKKFASSLYNVFGSERFDYLENT